MINHIARDHIVEDVKVEPRIATAAILNLAAQTITALKTLERKSRRPKMMSWQMSLTVELASK